MFVDSHCHLEMETFDKDRSEVIARSLEQGLVYILTVGTEARYFQKVKDLTVQNPSIYGALGIHPHNSSELDDDMIRKIEPFLADEKIVAYGEIGLDFFRNYAPRNVQVEAFRRQIELARKADLPIIVHSRQAKDETLEVLQEMAKDSMRGVIHCYSYDVDTARRFLDMGFHISIPGTITYKNSGDQVDVVRYLPVERLLTETDAPFLTPNPHRGKRNEPHLVKLATERVAEIKKVDIGDLCASLRTNFERLFLNNQR